MNSGILTVQPQAAYLSVNTESFGRRMDPFVAAQIGQDTKSTRVASQMHMNPVWQDVLTFRTNNDPVLNIQVLDYDYMTANDLIGQVSIPLADIYRARRSTSVYNLIQKGRPSGQISISFEFTPDGLGAIAPVNPYGTATAGYGAVSPYNVLSGGRPTSANYQQPVNFGSALGLGSVPPGFIVQQPSQTITQTSTTTTTIPPQQASFFAQGQAANPNQNLATSLAMLTNAKPLPPTLQGSRTLTPDGRPLVTNTNSNGIQSESQANPNEATLRSLANAGLPPNDPKIGSYLYGVPYNNFTKELFQQNSQSVVGQTPQGSLGQTQQLPQFQSQNPYQQQQPQFSQPGAQGFISPNQFQTNPQHVGNPGMPVGPNFGFYR